MVELRHGPQCDADLRHDGCVCTETLTVEDQAAELSALIAEWAERIAKAEFEETDRQGRAAFA